MKRLLLLLTLAALLAAPAFAELDWADLAPDAGIMARPMDGGTTGQNLEGVSWVVARPELLDARRVWFDLLTPTNMMGFGGSVDVVPGGPACIGGAWRGRWFGYVGAHFDVSW